MRRTRQLPAPALALAAAILAGCAATATRSPAPLVGLGEEELWRRYARAVEEARIPDARHLSRRLVAILAYTEGLTWNDQGQVLMVTWSKGEYFPEAAGASRVLTHGPAWVTASPFLQRFCRGLSLDADRLRLRIAQRLGIAPSSRNDSFVEMWVDPATMFRPCADPEVIDGECTLDLTTAAAVDDGGCPWARSFAAQTGRGRSAVSAEHLQWMCDNWQQAYGGDAKTSFPWTALGYTYDWGNPTDVHGESEFVVPQGTTVVIHAVTPMAEYCAARR